MPWVQLTLNTNPHHAEALEDMLLLCGAGAVTLLDGADQPVFEPEKGSIPLWQDTHIMGLFDAQTDAKVLLNYLTAGWQEQFPSVDFPQHKLEILEDKDWQREWMARFEPIQFGPTFWVCPSWKPVPDPNATNLVLDPGLAFGTGTHPTTNLCLQWIAQQDWQGKSVIDYGCGSGILALAALLLGAQKVVGIDNDDQALIATQDNAQRNNISLDRIPTYLPSCLSTNAPNHTADILVANILASPLIELAPRLAQLVISKGKIALSGILCHQSESVISAYQPWFDKFKVTQKEDWVRINAHRL